MSKPDDHRSSLKKDLGPNFISLNPAKKNLTDLALFGGAPAFTEKLHVGRPNIGDRQRLHQRLDEILDRRWLTNEGPVALEFEARLATLAGTRHAIAFCNATVALELLVRAAKLTDEVIVPSFTFVATVHCLHAAGLTPVFCDVDPVTHNLDPEKVEALITPRTSAILAVHLWGNPCDVEKLAQIAGHHRLALLFDAAHATGCSVQNRSVGSFGLAEVFSFHGTKFINSFEGGAVITNDDELAARLRLLKNFGFAGFDKVVSWGTNGKMSEIAAAMGLTSLESMNEFIAVNRRNYKSYRLALKDLPGVSVFTYREAVRNNFQYVVLTVDESVAGVSRDRLVGALVAENVIARRYFYPGCHRMEPYRTLFPKAGRNLPVTEKLCASVLVLPTGTAVGPAEIDMIANIIRIMLASGNKR
jgi:dTDP-4-amino-4,6-dideoxygalactose transaminase